MINNVEKDKIVLPIEIKPLRDKVITTMFKYEYDVRENGIISHSKGDLKEFQNVIAIGSHVQDIKVGNVVKINLAAYGREVQARKGPQSHMEEYVKKMVYNPPIEELNGEPVLMLTDFDIDYVVTDARVVTETEPEPASGIIMPETKIIV
jgi:co-chaperonin GroES (HSP10)